MEYIGIKNIKETYSNQLVNNNDISKANRIILSDTDVPIFNSLNIYEESEPNKNEINESISDISIDLLALNKEFVAIANKYKDLMSNTKMRLEAVERKLTIEENRIKDLNIICGNYDEFTSIKTLDNKYFSNSNFGYNDYTFFAYQYNSPSKNKPNLTILSIDGNGYEGNKYVYKDGAFLSSSIDTSARNYLIDTHISTAYEYSRLTCNSKIVNYPQDVNFDAEEALCTITLKSDNKINTLQINSDIKTLILKDILCSSDDGKTYNSYWDKEISINDLIGIYNDNNYIYGTGIICFPTTNYLKLIFKSNGVTYDKIAYSSIDTTIADKPINKIIELEDVKRHVIRLNSINVINGEYKTTTNIQSLELIDNAVESIAIFANEYVPNFFPNNKDYIQYILTINGEDYDIVPINSNKDGIKVIRTLDNNIVSDSYVKYINENIKSAKLSIVIETPYNNITPYISNLKVCYGKAVVK